MKEIDNTGRKGVDMLSEKDKQPNRKMLKLASRTLLSGTLIGALTVTVDNRPAEARYGRAGAAVLGALGGIAAGVAMNEAAHGGCASYGGGVREVGGGMQTVREETVYTRGYTRDGRAVRVPIGTKRETVTRY